MYGEWCTEHPIIPNFTPHKKLNKCQCDILRFVAEKGSHSMYDLAKKLGYRYPYLHKNTEELGKMQLIDFRKDSAGDRIKKMVELNFRGSVVFLFVWKADTEEKKRSTRLAIAKHPELFPFSMRLKEIEKIVGEEMQQEELIRTVGDIANGGFVEIKIDHINLKFPAFIYSFVYPSFFPPKTDFKGKERNQKFADFLASQDELKKAYISFLAIQDILDLAEDRLKINDSEKFRSERELAFFEKREIPDSPLFQNERLNEIFPKYAEMKYVFTGSLMTRLLWKKLEKPTPEKKKGFHVHFPKGVVVTPIT